MDAPQKPQSAWPWLCLFVWFAGIVILVLTTGSRSTTINLSLLDHHHRSCLPVRGLTARRAIPRLPRPQQTLILPILLIPLKALHDDTTTTSLTMPILDEEIPLLQTAAIQILHTTRMALTIPTVSSENVVFILQSPHIRSLFSCCSTTRH